jgi:GT2 family glycosyltransferase
MLDEIGGFDEDFFAYADDADLGIRGRLAGWECRYAPDAVVHHRHSSTSGPYSSQKIYWVERNRLWLAVKTFPLWLLVLSPLFTATRWTWNFAAALLGRGAAGNFRRESSLLELVRTLWRAYRDGVRRADLMWRKRRSLDKIRKLSNRQFCSLLIRYRISARRLAFQDVQRI